MIGKNNVVEDCYFHHIDYTVSSLRNLMTTVVNNGDNGIFTRNTVHTTGASSQYILLVLRKCPTIISTILGLYKVMVL